MRLFVAIEVPEQIKGKLGELSGELPSPGLKKVDVGNMHITLRFLGEVGEEEAGKAVDALSGVQFSPFKARVAGVGVFPNKEYVRVVWAGIHGEGIQELAGKTEEALAPLFGREKRGFSGHLTLARVHRKMDLGGFLDRHRAEEFGEFGVSRFLLMKSVLQKGGPEYSVVAEFPAIPI